MALGEAENWGVAERVRDFVGTLLCMDWDLPGGRMRLCGSLRPEALKDSPFYQNSRLLLQALADEDGAAATTSHNLNRAFVGGMLDRLSMLEISRKTIRQICKVINESDIRPLHLARVVAECAGLVKRRAGRFHVTPAGRRLLPEAQAGALFRTLFIAYYRKFNLEYACSLRTVPGIQDTMAVTLWRLDSEARDWVSVKGLAPRILLPKVLDRLEAATHPPHVNEEWLLCGLVLDALLDWGLIERKKKGEWPLVHASDHIRITRLWRQFFWFEWQP